MKNYIAIDIGGTNTRVALLKEGNIEWIKKFKTEKDNFKKELELIDNAIKHAPDKIEGIGISAPGPSDYEKGIFEHLPNLPKWKGINFVSEIKKITKIKKVVSQNDANLMALYNHMYFGNQSGITQFFTVSTGLGAGLIINNKIFKGSNGKAQEIANMPTAFSKEKGKGLSEGSLELFSSGSGIESRSKIKTDEAFLMYGKNDKVTKIINEGIEALANAIATSISLINPNLIVFDGSVARYNEWYINEAIKLAKTRVFKVQLEGLRFEFATAGDDSALLGAYEYVKKSEFL